MQRRDRKRSGLVFYTVAVAMAVPWLLFLIMTGVDAVTVVAIFVCMLLILYVLWSMDREAKEKDLHGKVTG